MKTLVVFLLVALTLQACLPPSTAVEASAKDVSMSSVMGTLLVTVGSFPGDVAIDSAWRRRRRRWGKK